MTLLELKKYVGRKCNIMTQGGVFVDGLVSEADIAEHINNAYYYLQLQLAEKYPENFTVQATQSLEADVSLYAIGGEASDTILPVYVGIKYDTTDTNFTRCTRRSYKQLFSTSTSEEGFAQSTPYYYLGTIKNSTTGVLVPAIGIVPTPDTTVTDGLLMRYTELADNLDDAADIPYAVPATAHELIAKKAVADVWEQKGDWAKSERTMNRFLFESQMFFDNYQPWAADEPKVAEPGRTFNPRQIVR